MKLVEAIIALEGSRSLGVWGEKEASSSGETKKDRDIKLIFLSSVSRDAAVPENSLQGRQRWLTYSPSAWDKSRSDIRVRTSAHLHYPLISRYIIVKPNENRRFALVTDCCPGLIIDQSM